MARMSMTASDGTVFGVFESANGNYIAVERDDGCHYAPSPYKSLPWWSDAEARRELREEVRFYEKSLRQHDGDDD